MSGPLVWHLLMTAFLLLITVAALTLVFNIHSVIGGTGAFQSTIVYPVWLVTFLMGGAVITENLSFYHVVWFYGIPWPYFMAFVFLFIRPLNTFLVSGTIGVVAIALWLGKILWIYG